MPTFYISHLFRATFFCGILLEASHNPSKHKINLFRGDLIIYRLITTNNLGKVRNLSSVSVEKNAKDLEKR